jgi:type II secretory pathway component PulK
MWTKSNSTRLTVLKERQGVALLTALGVLAIVYLLGAAYVSYMTIETEDVQLTTREVMVRATAERGVLASLSEVGETLAAGGTPEDIHYENWPLFEVLPDGDTPQLQDHLRAQVTVSVVDENGKINLNSAPVRLLESVLGTDAATARAIRQALPRPGTQPAGSVRWLIHADELLTRGFVDADRFAAIPNDTVTVFPIPGTAPGAERLNINSANPHALAAAFDIDMEAARNLAAQRPFASMDEAVAAVGKDPATFAVPPPNARGAAETTVLSLSSRCYRLRSIARIEKLTGVDSWRPMGETTLEAVAVFDEEGRGTILSWRAIHAEAADDRSEVGPDDNAEDDAGPETQAPTEESAS